MKRRIVLQAAAAGVASSLANPGMLMASSIPVLGVSLPITGVQAEVAKDLELGYRLALSRSGASVSLQILDDESKPDRVAANIRKFASDANVVAVSGIVGTPHAQAAIPICEKEDLPLIGLRSGAQSLRNGKEGVYHLRASFEEELNKMVRQSVGAGYKKIAILYSNDSFGLGSKNHLAERLTKEGIEVISSTPVERNGSNVAAAAAITAEGMKSINEPMAVVLLLIAKPMMAAARELRQTHRLIAPMFAMSFVATREVATTKDDYLAGLGLVSAFPLPRASIDVLARQFRQDVERTQNGDALESLTAFEGYFYGRVAFAAIAEMKSRERVIGGLRAGVSVAGAKFNFDKDVVGYRYLEVLRKTTIDGKLRA